MLLGCLLGALPGWAAAEVLATPSAPAQWLEPTADGVVALLRDGRAVRLEGHRTLEAAGAWRGDRLVRCGDRVLGVDAEGRLAMVTGSVAGSARGPRVSAHATPACLPSGEVVALGEDGRTLYRLSADLAVLARGTVEALPDTGVELVPAVAPLAATPPRSTGDAAPPLLALLSEPTFRYRHGVLGDEVEAGGVTLLRPDDLGAVARLALPADEVVEQLRVTPFTWRDDDDRLRRGAFVTVSSEAEGAGVVALEALPGGPTGAGARLERLAAAPPIGTGHRWLNLFAARDGRAYAVHTPHLGGPLVRYRLVGARDAVTLRTDAFALGVTNHVIGSRNLDLGALLPATAAGLDLLALPSRDLRTLRVVACREACRVVAELPLAGRLSSNVAAVRDGRGLHLYAGDDSGAVHRFDLDAGGRLRR